MRALALQSECDLLCTAPIAVCLEAEAGEADPFARLGSVVGLSLVECGWKRAFKGSLTSQDIEPTDIRKFTVAGELPQSVAELACRHADFEQVNADVTGVAFADGSISLSTNITVPDGWGICEPKPAKQDGDDAHRAAVTAENHEASAEPVQDANREAAER